MEKMLGKSGFFVTGERERREERCILYKFFLKMYNIICCCISCTNNNIVKRKTHHYYYEVCLNELPCVYEITSIRAKSCFFFSLSSMQSPAAEAAKFHPSAHFQIRVAVWTHNCASSTDSATSSAGLAWPLLRQRSSIGIVVIIQTQAAERSWTLRVGCRSVHSVFPSLQRRFVRAHRRRGD